jgi:hypothetical protein
MNILQITFITISTILGAIAGTVVGLWIVSLF